MRNAFCDGADCTPYQHVPGCTYRVLPVATAADMARLVADEDGATGRRAVICRSCREYRDNRGHGLCAACIRRWERAGRPVGGPPPVRRVQHHEVVGTTRGWDLHRRRGTEPCQPCRDAHNAAERQRYAARMGGAA